MHYILNLYSIYAAGERIKYLQVLADFNASKKYSNIKVQVAGRKYVMMKMML
jgi:hypothetical protein